MCCVDWLRSARGLACFMNTTHWMRLNNPHWDRKVFFPRMSSESKHIKERHMGLFLSRILSLMSCRQKLLHNWLCKRFCTNSPIRREFHMLPTRGQPHAQIEAASWLLRAHRTQTGPLCKIEAILFLRFSCLFKHTIEKMILKNTLKKDASETPVDAWNDLCRLWEWLAPN